MIPRIIKPFLQEDLFQGKAIILIGPRQVGKTTLLTELRNDNNKPALWLNCDEPDTRLALENATSTQLKEMIGDHELLFIDEAQRVANIGLTLKLIVDNIKHVQVIATGSSALDLANKINEPLTGRKWEYQLFPISTQEMVLHTSKLEETRLLEQRLIYGYYPDIINHPSKAQKALEDLSNNYLYKDLLSLENIRKPAILEKIVTALALQVGSEVSFSELSRLVGADQKTIEHYVHLLEKCYILFQVSAFSRNLRNEIKKGRKIYFYDNGVRNAVIKNFNPLGLRQDVGALWENYLMSERRKCNAYRRKYVNSYFWRTHAQNEIDYIEESGGVLTAVEFKWKEHGKVKLPEAFAKAYSPVEFLVVDRKNYMEFISS